MNHRAPFCKFNTELNTTENFNHILVWDIWECLGKHLGLLEDREIPTMSVPLSGPLGSAFRDLPEESELNQLFNGLFVTTCFEGLLFPFPACYIHVPSGKTSCRSEKHEQGQKGNTAARQTKTDNLNSSLKPDQSIVHTESGPSSIQVATAHNMRHFDSHLWSEIGKARTILIAQMRKVRPIEGK